MSRPATITVEKEMSINHGDFFRILPKALDGGNYRIDGNRIVALAVFDRRFQRGGG
jgi:hypothetical protein